ncbi:hypothetical protein CAL7102_02974 [Dulcicalothrix desertica PCC 7102]|nr:hypothetical protein CAL7102_02974 [Dulcicalothrix desertica PCC 7102]
MKKETLPEALLRLGLLYQKIKHLDVETKTKIMADPSLLPQYVNERNLDNIAV